MNYVNIELLNEEEFINDLKEIQEFQEMRKTLQKRNENFLESFGEAWKGRLTDLDNLRYLVNFIEKNNITELEKSKQNQINEILKLKN